MSVGPVQPPPGGGAVPSAAPAASGSATSGAATPVTANPGPATGGAVAGAPPTAQSVLAALAAETLPTQDSLAPLLADLTAAGQAGTLPPAVQALAQRILGTQTPLDTGVTAAALKAAVHSSGLFLEAGLAAALQGGAAPDLGADLKALLLRFTAALAPAALTPPTAAPPTTPQAALNQAAAQQAQTTAARAQPPARRATARPVPPVRGTPTAGQVAAEPSPELEHTDGHAAQVLLRGAQAALARLHLSQAASTPLDDAHAAWRFDLPVANPSGPGFAQFEISRDGAGSAPRDGAPVWRARFSMDLEPGGPVHAEVSLSGGRTRVTLWAERDGAFRDLAAEQGELVGALAGPEGADAAVRVLFGAPPPPPSPASGNVADSRGMYVDRRS